MNHPFLQFDENDAKDGPCVPFARSLWGRRRLIGQMRHLDWDVIKELNQTDRLRPLVTAPWSRLWKINQPHYRELIVEFFASYEFTYPCEDIYSKRHGLKFRLGGIWRRISVASFAKKMGLYTEAELRTESFDGLHDFSNNERNAFWDEIGTDPYDARSTKATKIRDPLYRLIHRLLTDTIAHRGDSCGNIPSRDLFYLYCIVHQTPCNLGHCLAYFLTTASGKRSESQICGGGYITQLAKALGVLTPEVVNGLTKVCDTLPLDIRALSYMRLVAKVDGGGYRLKSRDGTIWDPEPEILPAIEAHSHNKEPAHEEEIHVEPGQNGGAPFQGQEHADFMQFLDGLEPMMGPNLPTTCQIWSRFENIEGVQDEILCEQEKLNSVLRSLQDNQQRGFEWLFSAFRSAASHHCYALPPPPSISSPAAPGSKRSRSGFHDDASGSGASRDD